MKVTMHHSLCHANVPSAVVHLSTMHMGSTLQQKYFLRTAYNQIWLPLTYVEMKFHFTAEIVW